MAKKPTISRSKSNEEKRETYEGMFQRYNSAMEAGFYYEAVFILYAVLEDRVSSFLFHAGLITITDRYEYSKGVANAFAKELNKDKDGKKDNIDNIGDRLNMLIRLVKLAGKEENTWEQRSDFEKQLLDKVAKLLEQFDVKTTLAELDKWKEVRNEITHALMRKNFLVIEGKMKEIADNGYKWIRELDNIVNSFKRGENLREKFKIEPITCFD